MTDPTCSITDCGRPHYGRSWCQRHYGRWHRTGELDPRLPGEIRAGLKVCARCKTDQPVTLYGVDKSVKSGVSIYCRPCIHTISSRARAENPDRARAANRKWASANPQLITDKVNRRRALKRAAFVEHVDRAEVFESYRWVCQLCLVAIDPAIPWPSPWVGTLDHIIPLALGGTHERSNMQPAHMSCNSRKGPRIA